MVLQSDTISVPYHHSTFLREVRLHEVCVCVCEWWPLVIVNKRAVVEEEIRHYGYLHWITLTIHQHTHTYRYGCDPAVSLLFMCGALSKATLGCYTQWGHPFLTVCVDEMMMMHFVVRETISKAGRYGNGITMDACSVNNTSIGPPVVTETNAGLLIRLIK